jgi:Dolichyl-phosphate-mannose-protein mannosyltransferase
MSATQVPGGLRFGMELVRRLFASRLAPLFFGCLTALEMGYVWGMPFPVAVVHDEAAYLFQAKSFAAGRWAASPPPLPEFFEQFHVLVTPVFAAKYLPGHSLVLAPGVRLGVPALVPLALAGAAGGLLFLLARRLANPWVALLTWMIWTTTPANLRFLPSYLSEVTTTALWLLGWWALERWTATGRGSWLGLLSLCAGWGLITRPLTAVAFALPAGILALRTVIARRAWRQLLPALLPGAATLLIVPIWNARTIGSAWVSPLAVYTRDYLPYDRLGFGLDDTSPLRRLPADFRGDFDRQFRDVHASHTLARLPETFVRRLAGIAGFVWNDWRAVLLACTLLGFLYLPRPGWVAVGSAALLFLLYLAYAHPAEWIVYYLESFSVLAFLAGLGLWGVISIVLVRPRPPRREVARLDSDRVALVALLLVLVAASPLRSEVARARTKHFRLAAYQLYFRELVATIPEPRAVVFVRYGRNHDPHRSLIANEPDLGRAKTWIVYDRGKENTRLMSLAPDRVAYLFDDTTRTLVPLGGEPRRSDDGSAFLRPPPSSRSDIPYRAALPKKAGRRR